jgi:fatty aldehyde-generating acyl-ACP reductase
LRTTVRDPPSAVAPCVTHPPRARTREAVDVAVARGASVIGLGGLTAPATEGGALILPRLPGNITVTNGNALTAAVARRNVRAAVDALKPRRPACVAVIGATGPVGMPASTLLAQDGYELLLVGPGLRRTTSLLGALADGARLSGDIADVAGSVVVVVVTSSETARVRLGRAAAGDGDHRRRTAAQPRRGGHRRPR